MTLDRSWRTTVTMLAVTAAALFPLLGFSAGPSGGNDLLTGTALAADPDSGLQATIRRTSHGIPHIIANDFGGLGFGYGYAFAQDNFCVLADVYVTVNGERSKSGLPLVRWAPTAPGPRAATAPRPTTSTATSSTSASRTAARSRTCSRCRRRTARGPSSRRACAASSPATTSTCARRASTTSPTACRDKPWVREITELDAYRRFYQLGLIASQGVAIDGIGGAAAAAAGRPDPARCRRRRTCRASSPSSCRSAASARTPSALGPRGDRQRQGHAARQPALPVGRLRALLPGPAHDPGRDQRQRRRACSACRSSTSATPTTSPGATRSRPPTASRRSS